MSAIGPTSTREIMSDMGVNPTLASMATPGLYWTPAESDPQSAITMVIVQGIQKALKRLGFPLKTHGSLDSATQNAIAEVAGRNWASQPWLHIYITIKQLGDYEPRTQITWKEYQSTAIGEALGLDDIYDAMGDLPANLSPADVLKHDLVKEWPTSSVKFTQIKTRDEALKYAARAFHVSVTAGLKASGSLQATWADAAFNYFQAVQTYKANGRLDQIMPFIAKANQSGDIANKGSTVPVRLEPTTEPPPLKQAGFGGGTLGILAAALLGGWLLFGRKGAAGKPTRRKPARRRPTARRRRR